MFTLLCCCQTVYGGVNIVTYHVVPNFPHSLIAQLHLNLLLPSTSLLPSPLQPERIKLEDGKQGYDIRADIWSLGISLVELTIGASPYQGNNFRTEFEMLTHIVEAPSPLPDRGKFSPELYDFVAQWYEECYNFLQLTTFGTLES